MANQVFGSGQIDTARELVLGELVRWGYGARWLRLQLPVALAHIMLCNRSPDLAELTTERLQVIHDRHVPPYVQKLVVTTSRALAGLGFIRQELEPGERVRRRLEAASREPADCPRGSGRGW
jgi:hypothetical protein